MEIFNNFNYLAIVVAAIVYFVIGFLWYGPFFGARWAKEVDLKMDGESSMPVLPMIGQVIMTVIFTFGMALLLQLVNKTGLVPGIITALGAIVFLIFPLNGSTWFFKGKPVLFLIDFSYQSVGALVIGAILGVWR